MVVSAAASLLRAAAISLAFSIVMQTGKKPFNNLAGIHKPAYRPIREWDKRLSGLLGTKTKRQENMDAHIFTHYTKDVYYLRNLIHHQTASCCMEMIEQKTPRRDKTDRRGRLFLVLTVVVGGLVTAAWITLLIWLLFF